jgi:hypothetical protein
MVGSGRSRHKIFVVGGPRACRGRALSRGGATARPSPRAVSAHSGHDRSAKHRRELTGFHHANNLYASRKWRGYASALPVNGGRKARYDEARQ